ncbi:MAG: hypothetical protein JRI23_03075 [Deltaproteobacteria bacterium]|jgi:hypothetical protein|nr:hypothetical protein [Deltaproteobacteria bacterium]MBW2530487.1 hypothetical protein [Deltaproteobacteria bacterium]
MTPLAFHLRASLADRRVIAPTTQEQRILARAVLEAARPYPLIAFRAADNHLHLLAACCREWCGKLLRYASSSIRQRLRLPVPFGAPHFEPVRDQRHLVNAFHYQLRQDDRHDVDLDPWAEASNLPDLLGLRPLGRYTAANVARWLPRIQPAQLLARFGIEPDQLLHGPLPRESFHLLADAAAAAASLPSLEGRSDEVVQARRAAVHVASGHLTGPEVATLLGASLRTVRRLHATPAPPDLVDALRRQLRLRTYGHPSARHLERSRFPLGDAIAGG